MKPLQILFLLTLAVLRLQAVTDPPDADGEWGVATRQAEAQLRRNNLSDAAQTSKRALRLAQRYGDTDVRVPVTYYQLGNIFRDWGHCSAARANYSHSVAAWEKVPEPTPRFVMNAIAGLIGTLLECDQFTAAEKAFRTYAPQLQRYQSGPLDEAVILGLRAAVSRAQKNYREAETYYRRALQLLEQAPDSTQLMIEEERVNLAVVIDKQGRHDEALEASEHVISFLDHNPHARPATLIASFNNAACSLADLGRKAEARHMFERALAAATGVYGEDNRFTAKIMLNYARILRENQETPAAEAMQKKGAASLRRALARDSATVDVADLQ